MISSLEHGRSQWDFPKELMDVLVNGKSAVDLPKLNVVDWEDATNFVKSYGYNPDESVDAKFIHSVIIEAIHFIEQHLISARARRKLRLPKQIAGCDDVRHLMLWASDRENEGLVNRLWACAILRVMHTIAHIDGVVQMADPKVAFEQIFKSFSKYVKLSDDGDVVFGGDESPIMVDRVEWKKEKSRHSIILKLLHKQANVAETINDIIGVRIVTRKLSDVLRVVSLLRKYYMISFPNCNPSRARNTLINTKTFYDNMEKLNAQCEAGDVSEAEFARMIDQLALKSSQMRQTVENPHTSSTYRAIQITARQLIRWPDPRLRWLEKIKKIAEENRLGIDSESKSFEKILSLLRIWGGKEKMEETAFFPFEIQIMDFDSYQQSQIGKASHDRYKQSQLRTARRRVLGDLQRAIGK
jgi:uncharacterized protein (TIGR04552 family)